MTSQLLAGESPQLKLVDELRRGYEEKDLDSLAKNFHKDFRRYIYPSSIGQPVRNKEEWLKHVSGMMTFATALDSTTHSVIEAPGRVIVHSTTEAKNSFGVNTARESIFIMHIVTDDDGSLKVKQIEEFTDSKAYLEGVQALAAATNK